MTVLPPAEGQFRVLTGDWNELGAGAAAIRAEVFLQEQQVPLHMEWDGEDETAIHAVAYDSQGRAVATGRLVQLAGGRSQIGRMAVKSALRGANLGRSILQALVGAADRRGDRELVLHAQCSARGFYEKAGFTAVGDPFDEVAIPHIEMYRRLRE